MLTRVDVVSENPFYLNIRGARPTDSILVDKIEGLDPPDIDTFMGDFARDGGTYGGRRVPPRSVTFTLTLNPNFKLGETHSGLRALLYKAFLDPYSDSDGVKILLKDDMLSDRYVFGYTEKFECDIFTPDPTAMISMLCPDPYLLDETPVVTPASGPTVPFTYTGTAEAGIEIDATLTTSSSVLKFDLNGRLMTINYGFQAGDQVSLNTSRGSRRLTVTRSSVTTDILYALATTFWHEVHAPNNLLMAYGATTNDAVANITEVTIQGRHWGI